MQLLGEGFCYLGYCDSSGVFCVWKLSNNSMMVVWGFFCWPFSDLRRTCNLNWSRFSVSTAICKRVYSGIYPVRRMCVCQTEQQMSRSSIETAIFFAPVFSCWDWHCRCVCSSSGCEGDSKIPQKLLRMFAAYSVCLGSPLGLLRDVIRIVLQSQGHLGLSKGQFGRLALSAAWPGISHLLSEEYRCCAVLAPSSALEGAGISGVGTGLFGCLLNCVLPNYHRGYGELWRHDFPSLLGQGKIFQLCCQWTVKSLLRSTAIKSEFLGILCAILGESCSTLCRSTAAGDPSAWGGHCHPHLSL